MYNLKNTEMIFVFTGPDGSGRKTVSQLVAENTLQMKGVISYTTREKRQYEKPGKDYHFISSTEFKQAEEKGEFLESVSIEGYYYGIKVKDVQEAFKNYGCIYLVLNKEGAEILKNLYGNKVARFFVYANRDTVIERQKERGDDQDVIDVRLARYDDNMAYQDECEHSFENYRLDHTAFEITETIKQYINDLRDLQEDPTIKG